MVLCPSRLPTDGSGAVFEPWMTDSDLSLRSFCQLWRRSWPSRDSAHEPNANDNDHANPLRD